MYVFVSDMTLFKECEFDIVFCALVFVDAQN